jgi:hypothetical protein
VPRRKSNLQHVILSERKPLHRIGKEETITLDTLETLLVFHSFDFILHVYRIWNVSWYP